LKPEVRAAKEAIGWEARSQHHGYPLSGDLAVSVELYWGDRRKHDIDNIKALLDALTGIIWIDDGQIIDLHITKAYDKADPHVDMSVQQLRT
jgi:Holliday junction resolvase RusA-like endonuclease